MRHPQFTARRERSVPTLFVNDLCAQMTPLNRYGPTGLGAAIGSGLRALTSAVRPTICSAAGCDRS